MGCAAGGRSREGNSSSNFCTWGGRAATAAAVSGSPGVIKRSFTCLSEDAARGRVQDLPFSWEDS
ncbi:MAG: hypothetical protein ACK56I_26020, partial [bacterium]